MNGRLLVLSILCCLLAYCCFYLIPLQRTRLSDTANIITRTLRKVFEYSEEDHILNSRTAAQKSDSLEDFENYESGKVSNDKVALNMINHTNMTDDYLELSEENNGLPVYLEYSEISVYMLAMLGSEEDELKRETGMRTHGFNEYVSDKIGFHRNIPDKRNKICKEQNYPKDLPVASVVICFYNEAWSTLLRSIHSILDKTPPQLVKEIILVDDCSSMEHLKESLDTYVSENLPKVKLLHSKERLGLIRARMLGARQATGDVLIFLDSHIEVNTKWLQPLLAHIKSDRLAVVVPIVDTIDAETFVYSPAPLVRGGFIWTLLHNWDPLPESFYMHNNMMSAEPIESPTMPGGLFAMDRTYFFELGEYDDGMEIWGGENLEISFRIWQCGGRLEIIPCSRVGHVFRSFRPYTSPTGEDTTTRNAARVAEVWLDEYKKHFYDLRPLAKNMNIGDISKRVELRRKLGCKSFKWYLNNIYPQMRVPGENPKVEERFRHPTETRPPTETYKALIKHLPTGLCVASRDKNSGKGGRLKLANCLPDDITMMWEVATNNGRETRLAGTRLCIEVIQDKSRFLPVLGKCHSSGGSLTWLWLQDIEGQQNQAFHPASGRCLAVSESAELKEPVVMMLCQSVSGQDFRTFPLT